MRVTTVVWCEDVEGDEFEPNGLYCVMGFLPDGSQFVRDGVALDEPVLLGTFDGLPSALARADEMSTAQLVATVEMFDTEAPEGPTEAECYVTWTVDGAPMEDHGTAPEVEAVAAFLAGVQGVEGVTVGVVVDGERHALYRAA